MKFQGIYTPVVTPFHDDFAINRDSFVETLEFLIAAEVDGLVIAGTTGEYYAQTAEERLAMMELAASAVKGRLPLIIGTGAIRTEDSVMLAEAAKAAGADGILVTTPPYAYPTGHEIAQHALAVDAAVHLPVVLYNYPGRMSVNMDAATLDALAGNPNFCAIKESSGDADRLHMLAYDYPHLQISCGMDDQALEFFAWGATSWVCAGSNFAPEAHMALYRACVVDGDFTRGRAIMKAMLPLMRVLEQGGKFVQSIKHGLTLRGIAAGPPRKPMLPLDAAEEESLAQVINEMNSAIDAINAS